MADHPPAPTPPTDLRTRAASRLTGTAATKGPSARAADALSVLHGMASSPATAADALALLHELQVHQVELELQAQEMQESRSVLEAAVRRLDERYDHQPVGCFTVDADLTISEVNLAGARLLGVEPDAAAGLRLDSFVTSAGVQDLRAMMHSIGQGGEHASAMLEWRATPGPGTALHADLGADPSGRGFLVVLTGCAPAAAPGRR